jgi:hypothetical protein
MDISVHDFPQINKDRIKCISDTLGSTFMTQPALCWIISDYMIGPVVKENDSVFFYYIHCHRSFSQKTRTAFFEYVKTNVGIHLLDYVFDATLCIILSFREIDVNLNILNDDDPSCQAPNWKLSDIAVRKWKIAANELALKVFVSHLTSLYFSFVGSYRGLYAIENTDMKDREISAVTETYKNLLYDQPRTVHLVRESNNKIVHYFGYWYL